VNPGGRKKSEVFKALLFRMWAAGAVCFFAAWGRRGAEEVGNAFSLDLIAGLAVILLLAEWIIVEPCVRLLFNTGRRIPPGKWGLSRLFSSLLHIVKITVILLLIVGAYYCLNIFCIAVFKLDENSVPVPLEPILFGILYGIYFFLFSAAESWIKKIVMRKGPAHELL
jgi:hypothetical protein